MSVQRRRREGGRCGPERQHAWPRVFGDETRSGHKMSERLPRGQEPCDGGGAASVCGPAVEQKLETALRGVALERAGQGSGGDVDRRGASEVAPAPWRAKLGEAARLRTSAQAVADKGARRRVGM